jgi:hypothetical protein
LVCAHTAVTPQANTITKVVKRFMSLSPTLTLAKHGRTRVYSCKTATIGLRASPTARPRHKDDIKPVRRAGEGLQVEAFPPLEPQSDGTGHRSPWLAGLRKPASIIAAWAESSAKSVEQLFIFVFSVGKYRTLAL